MCCAWVVCAHKQGWGWSPAGGRVGTGHQSFLIGRAAHKRSGCRRARQGSGRDYRNYPAANQALPRLHRQMEVISPYKNPRTLIYPSRGLLCLCSQSCIAAPRPTECDGHCFLNKIPFRYLLSSEAPGFRRLTDRSCGVTYSRRHLVLLAGSTLQISEAAIQRGRVRGCRAERKGEAEQKSSAEKHKHRQAQAQTSRAEEVCRGRQAQHTCQHQVQSGNKGVILGARAPCIIT